MSEDKLNDLKKWKMNLNETLVLNGHEISEELKEETGKYRDLLGYAIEQAERVQKLEEREKELININQHEMKYRAELETRNVELEHQNKELFEGLATIGNAIHEGEISGRGTDENLILEIVDKHWRNRNESK